MEATSINEAPLEPRIEDISVDVDSSVGHATALDFGIDDATKKLRQDRPAKSFPLQPIHTLPIELLAEVLVHIIEEEHKLAPKLTLSQVCSVWRKVMMQTSKLWKECEIASCGELQCIESLTSQLPYARITLRVTGTKTDHPIRVSESFMTKIAWVQFPTTEMVSRLDFPCKPPRLMGIAVGKDIKGSINDYFHVPDTWLSAQALRLVRCSVEPGPSETAALPSRRREWPDLWRISLMCQHGSWMVPLFTQFTFPRLDILILMGMTRAIIAPQDGSDTFSAVGEGLRNVTDLRIIRCSASFITSLAAFQLPNVAKLFLDLHPVTEKDTSSSNCQEIAKLLSNTRVKSLQIGTPKPVILTLFDALGSIKLQNLSTLIVDTDNIVNKPPPKKGMGRDSSVVSALLYFLNSQGARLKPLDELVLDKRAFGDDPAAFTPYARAVALRFHWD